MIKLCENGDGRRTVRVVGRPERFCRQCHITENGGEFRQVKVVFRDRLPGESEVMAVACAKTGKDIQVGGTAWLDPAETNIDALLWAGDVELIEAPKASAKAAKTEG